MNDQDRDNLNFLMNSDPAILKDWYDAMSEDDHVYAQELMTMYANELADLELSMAKNSKEFTLSDVKSSNNSIVH